MIRSLKICLFIFIVLIQGQAFSANADSTNIRWQTYSDEAFNQAKEDHKLVLLFAKATWCPWCQQMAVSFKDQGVTLLVNANFIPVLVDIDKDEKIAKQYRILNLPTLIILDGNKKVLETDHGLLQPQDLANKLKAITFKYADAYQ